MKLLIRIIFTFAAGIWALQSSGQSMELVIKQANGFFKSKQYFRAAPLYLQINNRYPQDYSILLKRAICEYEINNVDSAIRIVTRLMAAPSPETGYSFFLAGKLAQAKNEFSQAAVHFKKYLDLVQTGTVAHEMTIAEIKRCGNAINLFSNIDDILVEGAGSEVNTIWNEIGPIPSINLDARFYFSSDRESAGLYANYSQDFESPYDMYASSLYNGEWSDITALNANLNTKTHEILADFSENGRIVYFKKGNKMDQLKFYADTFKAGSEEVPLVTPIDIPFLNSGDEVFYFTDSFIIISSNRPGGLGGYDLYYSKRIANSWRPLVNLGIIINSIYDEVSPSLAWDGRTMFFSSNNINSIGGYDIFYTHYDDQKQMWTEPVNFGLPVNSGNDDRYFRLSKNKLGGFFASNRKTGVGGYDIYFTYFKQSPTPQAERSRPIFFADVPEYKAATLLSASPIRDTTDPIREVVQLPILYYISDDQLKLPSMLKKMDEVVTILEKYPSHNIIIEVFSDRSAKTVSLDILFSIKRAEAIKEYFVQQGIKPSRIMVKGYGSGFPVAQEQIDGKANPSAQSLNRRIEFTIFSSEPKPDESPVFIKDSVAVNERMGVRDRAAFLSIESQLNYKNMLLSSGNAANFEADQLGPVFIEKNNNTGKYELMTGIYPTFVLANAARKSWIAAGYEDALVIPYYDNQRIHPALMTRWSEKFPDLIQFIYRSE